MKKLMLVIGICCLFSLFSSNNAYSQATASSPWDTINTGTPGRLKPILPPISPAPQPTYM